ncbi:response regulator transcription factor [Parapedobacter koreensis]|uniref:Two component transcriptional regulator, LuxR family n=1 Tax=Parapedobacter koreensis TaxID=332977 RepID=A0A1H7TJA7_9SPHI|nr:response regulator transcription factor [Parapedobacter koreensis]SEL84871.1 two component transcriptional regulator, LuxR family [Parapedobacter koreensis]
MRILIIEDEIIIAQFIEREIQENLTAKTQIALGSEEALAAIRNFQPHLVLCDIELNGTVDGIDLMHQLKKPLDFELVFVTAYQSKRVIDRAYGLNPANYVIKPLDENRLYAGVLPVVKKIRLSAQQQPDKFRQWLTQSLTAMELTVLRLIARGKTTKEIADTLYLSPNTIKNHRHHICRKLDLDEGYNTLLRWALENYSLICME